MPSRTSAVCLLLAISVACKPHGAPNPQADEREIRFLITQYTASVDAADTKLAAEVWSASPSSTFIHPMGHERGWSEIEANLYRKIMGGFFSERNLTTRDASIHLQGDSAWVEFYWTFNAKLKSNGAPIETKGRETQVYKKDPQRRWRLVHVHYSAVLPTPPPPAAPQ